MKSFTNYLGLSLLLSLSAFGNEADDLLVARWSFNDRTLSSDIGQHRFNVLEHGQNSEYTFEDGAIRLGPGCLLVCESINSIGNEAHGTAVTIWARIKAAGPFSDASMILGLKSSTSPGDWRDMVFTTLHYPDPDKSSGFLGRLGNGSEVGSGVKKLPMNPSGFSTITLVFDGNNKVARYDVDGRSITRPLTTTYLAPFTNFSLGRLKASGGNATIIFDEVRIYWGALSPDLVNKISTVK